MPFEPHIPPSFPSEGEINAQLEKLAHEALSTRPGCLDLLRFLIKIEREGRYREPFTERRPRPTGKAISAAFYEYRHKHFQEPVPIDTEWAGKKLVADLDVALQRYYAKNGASDCGRVHIRIQRGRGEGYKPLIQPIAQWISIQKKANSHDAETPNASVDCRCLGNDREAMRYVLDKYRSTSPRLIGLRDTHVRAEVPMRYREDYYEELQAEFTAFLDSGDPDITKCTLIFGWEMDNAYVRMVQSAATEQGDKLKCFRLRNRGPLMNFILMDYEDMSCEVLFGWGLGSPGKPGAVFRSDDRRLIEQFSNFYEILLQMADRVPVESLLTLPVRREQAASSRGTP